MDPESLAFVVGPVLAPLVLLLALIQICAVGWGKFSRLVLAVAAAEAALVTAHWVVWWLSFDWVEGQAVPNALFDVTTPLMVVSAVTCQALCWVMIFRSRRPLALAVRNGLSIYGPPATL